MSKGVSAVDLLRRHTGALLISALSLVAARAAHAAEEGGTPEQTSAQSTDIRARVPLVAYAYTVPRVQPKAVGVSAFTTGVTAPGQDGVVGGGGSIWATPVDRLTLVLDARRSLSKEFTPSAAALVRIVGTGGEGFSLAGLGKFKVDGFAAGPSHDEIESEVEAGAVASFAQAGWFVDLNAIGGRGTGDEGETDAEARLRFGHAIGERVRLGVDGQVRARVAGPRYLPNGRTWDFAAGPQAMLALDWLFAALTIGPSTTDLTTDKIGWSGVFSFGGASF